MSSGVPARPPIRILLYHHVGPIERPDAQQGLYCHVDQFAAQMHRLARSSLDVVDLDRAVDAIAGRLTLERPAIVLTFDDAFVDFFEHAWPVLSRYGLPASVFAVAERIGARADWHRQPHPQADMRLMDLSMLRELAGAGIDIGAHSATHAHLDRLSAGERDREIIDAGQRLADGLGRPIRHFAYPYGHYDADVLARVERAGFVSGLTCIRNRAERASSLFELPREGMSYKDGRLRFAWKTRWRHARS